MAAPVPSPSLRALVAGLVDYAGLFPPAWLSMPEAVARYAQNLESADAWILGRFIVPAARLDQLAADAARQVGDTSGPWRLSALVDGDALDDARRIRAFNAAHRGRFLVDTAEVKADTPGQIELVTRNLGPELQVYVELPRDPDPRPLLQAVQHAGARAKIRTGGVTPDAFPSAAQLARFLARCAALRIPFKATAGLHHPLRGEYRVTYQPDAPLATMFGFLNVFVAGVLAFSGVAETELVPMLEERKRSSFTFGTDGLRWRHHTISLEQLAQARASFAIAFGSCSFREPVDDLRELALL
ncbi:MAG TPA: hypothetical protein VM033_01335 [Gemmatimonadaceae bacterium]|nr:hypothetical protein [Gemmatimonadaceae bacterium]